MKSNTDASRRIAKMFTTIYPERIASGLDGFTKKDWYVLGLNFGIIYNNVATKGDHEELVDTSVTTG